MQVFERGWLSANNILFDDGDSATLIDSGYLSHTPQTLALLHEALGGRPLARLINTHSHSDHIGGNAAVQAAFGCEIVVPAGMYEAVANWDEDALLLTVAAQKSARFRADRALAAGDRFVAGGLAWQAYAAPGHDMDALVFHNVERRILISGDALWRDGFGILFADVLGTGDGVGETRRTLETIARLSVDVVIPGHGTPFVEVDDALARAFGRLRAFEEDGARIARNAIRACITFTLLDCRQMSVESLTALLAEVPLYREANARFLGLGADALADWLVQDLVRAGVVRREGENLLAA
jgi:glyoxylase-like metal-dependent hydrolase (beta-lactamase superfamily II)